MTFKKGHIMTKEVRKKISLAEMGHTTTEETRQKISEANKGKVRSESAKRKIRLAKKGSIPWNKGKTGIYSKETLEKMRLSHIGRKPKENTIEKMKGRIPWNKGKTRIYSKETLEKMRLASMGRVPWNKGLTNCYSEETLELLRLANKGQIAWNKGKTGYKNGPHTEKSKQKMSRAKMNHIVTEETRQKIRNNLIDWDFYNEYGCTRSQYPYGSDWTPKLRKQIAERDNFTCQMCHEILPDKIATHHIDYDKNNNESSNLIFLCKYCHGKTNTNRVFWEQYFTELQIARGFGEEQYNGNQTVIDNWN